MKPLAILQGFALGLYVLGVTVCMVAQVTYDHAKLLFCTIPMEMWKDRR